MTNRTTAEIIPFPNVTGRVDQGQLMIAEADEIGRGFAALNPYNYGSPCCSAALVAGEWDSLECSYCGRRVDA